MLAPFGFRGLLDDVFPTHNDILPGLNSFAEPPVNARESDKALMLEIDVPRYRADEIRVESNSRTGIVTVTGHRAPGAFEDATGNYPHLLFGQASPTHFQRSFRCAPMGYDVGRVSHMLDHGVLRITIPKVQAPPPPKAITLFDGAHPVGSDGTLTTVDSEAADKQVRRLQRTRWPPVTKVNETDTQFLYDFVLPPEVHHQHLKLDLVGSQLTLQVHAGHSDKGDGLGSRYVTFSQSFIVPAGTTADRVHTSYEPGKFTIAIDKVPTTGGRAASQDVPVTSGKK
jgi:HSP20 family molecular chaperone IbpA